MLTIQYPTRPDDLVFAANHRTVARARPRGDGGWLLTNVAAGHTTAVPSREAAVYRAQTIVRMLTAGRDR